MGSKVEEERTIEIRHLIQVFKMDVASPDHIVNFLAELDKGIWILQKMVNREGEHAGCRLVAWKRISKETLSERGWTQTCYQEC